MSEEPFRLSMSQKAKRQLRILFRRAARMGLGDLVRQALERAEKQLVSDPESFGDPVHLLRKTGATLRQGVSPPFIIRFACFTNEKVVFVLTFKAIPSSPLDAS